MNEMTAEIARAKGAERLENVYFTVNLGTRFVVVGGINGKTHVVTCFKHGRVTKARPWKDACRSYGRGNEETVFTVVDDRLGSSRMKGRSMDDAFINHAIDEKLTGAVWKVWEGWRQGEVRPKISPARSR